MLLSKRFWYFNCILFSWTHHVERWSVRYCFAHSAVVFFFFVALPDEAKPTITSPAWIYCCQFTSLRFMRAVTVLSTIIVPFLHRQSHTRAVKFHAVTAKHWQYFSVPLITSAITTLELLFISSNCGRKEHLKPVAPTHSKSSIFMMIWHSGNAAPSTDTSPVSFPINIRQRWLCPATIGTALPCTVQCQPTYREDLCSFGKGGLVNGFRMAALAL